jgi:putative ABC transport system ATP-binding protein
MVSVPPPKPLLSVSNLQFRWNRRQATCLDIEDLQIAAGERVFVHGPSGSGKSTLLGLLGGVLTPDQGHIHLSVEGRQTDLGQLRASQRDRFRVDHVGFVFQQFNLIPYLSVLDNVLLPCRFSGRRRRQAGDDPATAARRLLAALDMGADTASRPVTDLSVGQQQRVAVARALIGRPELVIADEPTSALDSERQDRFLDLLLSECDASNASLIFVSHDRRLASHFTRHIALAEINRVASDLDQSSQEVTA